MTVGRNDELRQALRAMHTALHALFPDGLPSPLQEADALARAALTQEGKGSYSVQSVDDVHHLNFSSDGELPSVVGYFGDAYVAQRAAAALNACIDVPTNHLQQLHVWRDAAGGYHGLRRP